MAMTPIHILIDEIHIRSVSSKDFVDILSPIFYGSLCKSPSLKYMKSLILKFLKGKETDLETNDDFASLLADILCKTSSDTSCWGFGSSIANPEERAYVSYDIESELDPKQRNTISLLVYPQHNDVGVRKVWEAGACLAEFLIKYPHYVDGKCVVEFGSGVGLTGLIASAYGRAKSVHMTDYTDACILNLSHNIECNTQVLIDLGVDQCSVSSGYLEWDECAKSLQIISDLSKSKSSLNAYVNADVIIAADVVYDVDAIPSLIAAVHGLITGSKNKYAIFSTTYRNKDTFKLFEEAIEKHGMKSCYIEDSIISELPKIFPCYFDQRRDEVRISILTAA